jgi:dienelactone hydrolase
MYLRFDQLLDWFGWVAGALIIMVAGAGLIVGYYFARPLSMWTVGALAIGLGIGCLLFIPASPRVARALFWLVTPPTPTGPSGPLSVATVSVLLAPTTGDGPPIVAQIWYPAANDSSGSAPTLSPHGTPAITCADVMRTRRLSEARPHYPILLYAPSNGGVRDQNASTSTELASHGYVVAAIDDIDRDPPPPSDTVRDDSTEPMTFDFSSAEAVETTLRRGTNKARRQAERALAVLDRLEACANEDWKSRLQFDRVGFFGFSFGGATAAEAGVLDPRVVAVANLDGWLFGPALTGALVKPYLFLIEDEPVPGPRRLQSPDPFVRYYAILQDRFLQIHRHLINQPNNHGFMLRGSRHESFSDDVFDSQSYKTWFVLDPYRIKTIKDSYLLAFFDTYVRNMPSPLLFQSPSPFSKVEVLKVNEHLLDGAAPDAAQSSAASP